MAGRTYRRRFLLLGGVCLLLLLGSMLVGRYGLSAGKLLHMLWTRLTGGAADWSVSDEKVVFAIRLPRIAAAALVGAALAVSGTAYQGMFRNPMVSPDILGASTGAGFGAALAILLGAGYFGISLSAFCFGLLAVAAAWLVSRLSRSDPTVALILAGMMISSLFSAGTSFIKLVADTQQQLPAITYWLMGSLSSIKAEDVRFLVLPVGCLLTGALCGIPLSVLLHNTWPVLAVAVLLLLLFKSGSSAIGPIFNGISLAVRGLTLFGFCISVLQETSGIVLLEGLTPLAEIYPVICSIGAFLAGILPLFAFVQRLLTAPLTKLAARLQLEPASITGLVVTSANCIPTLLSLDTLEERGITLNTAYAVVAAYSVGDFLAFTLQFSPAHALPMMAGRLLSGLLAVVLCLKTTPKTT